MKVNEMTVIELIHLIYSSRNYRNECWYRKLSKEEKRAVDNVDAVFKTGIRTDKKAQIIAKRKELNKMDTMFVEIEDIFKEDHGNDFKERKAAYVAGLVKNQKMEDRLKAYADKVIGNREE